MRAHPRRVEFPHDSGLTMRRTFQVDRFTLDDVIAVVVDAKAAGFPGDSIVGVHRRYAGRWMMEVTVHTNPRSSDG